MDPKKQELNPELKEIYNRVMNAQVKTEPTQESTPDPTAVSPPAGGSQPGSFAPAGAGAQSAPFVFTGNKVTTSQAPNLSGTQVHVASSKKISGAVVAGLVAVLIVVWGLFWAKFFGLF